jgi:hypothetical protein
MFQLCGYLYILSYDAAPTLGGLRLILCSLMLTSSWRSSTRPTYSQTLNHVFPASIDFVDVLPYSNSSTQRRCTSRGGPFLLSGVDGRTLRISTYSCSRLFWTSNSHAAITMEEQSSMSLHLRSEERFRVPK